MSKLQFEQPSTLIRLYMGDLDYRMYMESKDDFDPFDTRDSIIQTKSDI